jgi:hypothetical protein
MERKSFKVFSELIIQQTLLPCVTSVFVAEKADHRKAYKQEVPVPRTSDGDKSVLLHADNFRDLSYSKG